MCESSSATAFHDSRFYFWFQREFGGEAVTGLPAKLRMKTSLRQVPPVIEQVEPPLVEPSVPSPSVVKA